MKKLLILAIFALTLTLGTDSLYAQERLEDVAKSKVAQLNEAVKLTPEQERTLFRVYLEKERQYRKHVIGQDTTNADVASNKSRIDTSFESNLKGVLTAEQYSMYKKI